MTATDFTTAAWDHWDSEDRTSTTPSMAFAEGANWARDHLEAHDARVRRDAAREALDGLAAWMSDLHDKYPSHAWYVPLSLDNITRYTTDNYPEETP